MNRAEFMRRLGLAGGAAMLGLRAANEEPTSMRGPNILWLSTEDIGPHLGCYGDPHAHTPTLDRLAREGIRYTNAYTVAPVCAPNRSGIITGVYPTTLGTHHMRSGGEGTQYSHRPSLPPEIKCFSEYLRDAGYYCTNNAKEDYNFNTPPTAWDESSNKAHWRNRPHPHQPFFAVFNFTGTHESAVRQTPEWHAKTTHRLTPEQRQDPGKITPPPFHPDTPVVRENWVRYYELITALDYWIADHLDQLERDGLADNTIVFFWSDHGAGLPRCKRWLYDSGTHVPLIVRFPKAFSDIPSAGTTDPRLISSIDFAPTVLNLAGLPIPTHMQGQPFLGPNPPAPRQYVFGARDRMDERYDTFRMVRDKRFKYIRNYQPFKPYDQFLDYNEQSPVMRELRRVKAEGLVTDGTRWTSQKVKPIEELYDTEQDPNELHNLADAPEHQKTLARLWAAHEEWMLQTKDLGLIPESELVVLGKNYGNRFHIASHLEEESPGFLSRLREIAVSAARPDAADRLSLFKVLDDPDPAIRYWALVGVRNLHSPEPAIKAILQNALQDASGAVRVLAAQTLMELDANHAAAMEILLKELASPDEWVRLCAALALDELGPRAKPATLALKKAFEDSENKYVVRVADHALKALSVADQEVK
ncbi:MAG: sulfatase-like hydrolase/transferase [Candidatus Hydrogenedentes bacterium]|nr:sulfatase-like hydrolase/transferase [Candidatus Hydrogenedentota bacterium]